MHDEFRICFNPKNSVTFGTQIKCRTLIRGLCQIILDLGHRNNNTKFDKLWKSFKFATCHMGELMLDKVNFV